ncbi:hypothetical protein OIU78_018500 [Salix suchowensis]|nr:hypothetical protein OIU78_018500 [Salix suchowensis]
MTEEDEWVHVAFNDDTLVVELLLNLSQPEQPPPPPRRRRRRRFGGGFGEGRSGAGSECGLERETTTLFV